MNDQKHVPYSLNFIVDSYAFLRLSQKMETRGGNDTPESPMSSWLGNKRERQPIDSYWWCYHITIPANNKTLHDDMHVKATSQLVSVEVAIGLGLGLWFIQQHKNQTDEHWNVQLMVAT